MATTDDALAAYLAGFLEEPGYLDYARRGPLSAAVLAEARADEELLSRARFGSLDVLDTEDERFRAAAASLLGFPADQIVFQPNTSTGLMHTMFGLTGSVLVADTEFPSLPFAAVRAAQALQELTVHWLGTDHGVVTPGEVRRQITGDTSAVAVSLVDYRTGHVADLDGIRQVIGDRLLIVDATQGLGVVDAAYPAADVVAAAGYKWLRAGRGTGLLAMSERAIAAVTPVFSGFTGVEGGPRFDGAVEVAEPVHSVQAFTVSNPDEVAQARLAAALEDVVAVGVDAVQRLVAEKAERIISLADEFALPVVSPRPEHERAGIVVVRPAADRLTALAAELANHAVSVTVRDGAVRFSPHAGTAEESFEMLLGALTSYATSTAG